jgi:hypothetical protein
MIRRVASSSDENMSRQTCSALIDWVQANNDRWNAASEAFREGTETRLYGLAPRWQDEEMINIYYTQSKKPPMDGRMFLNLLGMLLIQSVILAFFWLALGSFIRSAIVIAYIIVIRLWRWRERGVIRYEIDLDMLAIVRAWPFKQIAVPLDEIRRVRYGNLESFVYMATMSLAYNALPATAVKKATVIHLLEKHQIDESRLNSFNAVFFPPGGFPYAPYPPPGSDIKVRSFATNADNLVLLEGPINYLISPENPKAFVQGLKSRA